MKNMGTLTRTDTRKGKDRGISILITLFYDIVEVV